MLSFREFLHEAFAKSDLSGLRKEGLMFAKNFTRISSAKDYYKVVQAYFVWATRLEHTIYNAVLGMKSNFDASKEGYASKKLREKLWTVVLNKAEVWGLPDRNVGEIYAGHKVSAGEHGTTTFVYDTVSAPVWERIYQEFDKNKKNLYAKYTRILREAFNALDDYLATVEGDTVESHQNVERIKFDGVGVELLYRDENAEESKKKFHAYLHALKICLERLRHYKLTPLFQSAIFVLDLADSQTWDAGNYDHRGTIRSTAWAHNDPRVIAHEFGHHAYRHMSKDKRKGWENFIVHDKVKFTDDDYRLIKSVYDKLVPEMMRTQDHRLVGSYVIDGVWENLVRRLPNGLTKDLLQAWLKQNPVAPSVMHVDNTGRNQIEASFDHFREASAQSFSFHVPTGYSNKNVEEAFCEVFSYFIMDMGLQPIVARQFSEITGIRKH